MSSEKPTLEARHLSRSFGAGETATVVLRDISLDLYGGQVLLLMGPSGSGKSTLLAVLSGLLRPDRGEVVALGQHLGQMSEKEQRQFRLRHCGFIFQGFNLFPSLTAREQLEMVLLWGERASEARGAAPRRRGARTPRSWAARRPDRRPAFRRREAARRHRPRPHQEPDLLFRG